MPTSIADELLEVLQDETSLSRPSLEVRAEDIGFLESIFDERFPSILSTIEETPSLGRLQGVILHYGLDGGRSIRDLISENSARLEYSSYLPKVIGFASGHPTDHRTPPPQISCTLKTSEQTITLSTSSASSAPYLLPWRIEVNGGPPHLTYSPEVPIALSAFAVERAPGTRLLDAREYWSTEFWLAESRWVEWTEELLFESIYRRFLRSESDWERLGQHVVVAPKLSDIWPDIQPHAAMTLVANRSNVLPGALKIPIGRESLRPTLTSMEALAVLDEAKSSIAARPWIARLANLLPNSSLIAWAEEAHVGAGVGTIGRDHWKRAAGTQDCLCYISFSSAHNGSIVIGLPRAGSDSFVFWSDLHSIDTADTAALLDVTTETWRRVDPDGSLLPR